MVWVFCHLSCPITTFATDTPTPTHAQKREKERTQNTNKKHEQTTNIEFTTDIVDTTYCHYETSDHGGHHRHGNGSSNHNNKKSNKSIEHNKSLPVVVYGCLVVVPAATTTAAAMVRFLRHRKQSIMSRGPTMATRSSSIAVATAPASLWLRPCSQKGLDPTFPHVTNQPTNQPTGFLSLVVVVVILFSS
jgi:hypothetical protein